MWASQVALVVKKKKKYTCQCRRHKRYGFIPWVRKRGWWRRWQPTPIFLLEEFHEQRSLAATVYRVTESWTWLKQLSTHALYFIDSEKQCSQKYVFLCLVRGFPNLFKMRIFLLPTRPLNYAPNSALQDIRLEKLIFLWICPISLILYNTELDVHHW